MAITNELVKFLYGTSGKPSTVAGEISFHSGNQAIYVGDGTDAILVTSSVKDAKFENSVLTITKVGGDTVTLDFSDVASAAGVNSLLAGLRTDINTNATAITNLGIAVDASIEALDASYKAADASLKTAYEAADQAINTKIGTVAEGKTVVGLIEEAKAAANAAHSVVAKDSSFLTLTSSTAENGAITYTLGTSDVASAAALAAVSDVAEAAQTAAEVSTAISTAIDALSGSAEDVDDSSFVKVAVTSENGEVKTVTVTTDDIASAKELTRVAGRIDTFLDSEEVAGTVDTLHEIQAWMNGEGVDATELTEAIAEEAGLRALADSSIRTDFATADTALSNRIKAVEEDYLKASDKTELTNTINDVSDVANAAAVKTTTDASLALKADASVVYTKSETYTKTEVDGLVNNANTNASTAESNAKAYADAIKVNGQAQTGQEITLTGVNIKVGGTSNASTSTIEAAVVDLYGKVAAAEAAGVQSIVVNTEDANYAAVNNITGAVTFSIKTQDVSTAEAGKTGLVDALEAKNYVSFRITGVKDEVVGTATDASTAATIYGAKAYAKEYTDAQVAAAALKWGELK